MIYGELEIDLLICCQLHGQENNWNI